MSNLYEHALKELDLLTRNNPNEELTITPFVPQVLALVAAFGESGQSGGSAPFTSAHICNVLKKLFAFEPISSLTGDDSEWNDVSRESGEPYFQNNRCSHIFKGANGVAYDINGYVFWHWSERPLDEDEKGYPGVQKFKSHFTSHMSLRQVMFPCETPESIKLEVRCHEVNRETGEREPGSAWWHTVYPEWLLKENAELKLLLDEVAP